MYERTWIMTWTLKFLRLIRVAHKFSNSLCTTGKSNKCCFSPSCPFQCNRPWCCRSNPSSTCAFGHWIAELVPAWLQLTGQPLPHAGWAGQASALWMKMEKTYNELAPSIALGEQRYALLSFLCTAETAEICHQKKGCWLILLFFPVCPELIGLCVCWQSYSWEEAGRQGYWKIAP